MDYHRPTDLSDALALLADGCATVLAGGTDLRLQADSGRRPYGARLVNIRQVAGLDEIEVVDGRVRIGTLVSINRLRRCPLVARVAPVLASAADAFASDQIRNAGTLGGNLCNASPAGDMAVPLLLLDADVVLHRSGGGCRTVALGDFLLGPGRTALDPAEMLCHVEFALPRDGFRAGFRKSGPRPALEISIVSVGVAALVDAAGHWHDTRIAIGAAAPTAIRAPKAEAILDGTRPEAALLARASRAATQSARPLDDIRASAWYRQRLIGIFTKELCDDICAG